MNRDPRFLEVTALQREISQLEREKESSNRRLENARRQAQNFSEIYQRAEARYQLVAERLRQRMLAHAEANPTPRVWMREIFVTTYQNYLSQAQEEYQMAQQSLQQSEDQLQQTSEALVAARNALFDEFANRGANVPHVVDQAVSPLAQTVNQLELQHSLHEQDVENRRQVVNTWLVRLENARLDFENARQAENDETEAKLQRHKAQQHHEQMKLAYDSALVTTQQKILNIDTRIQDLRTQLAQKLAR